MIFWSFAIMGRNRFTSKSCICLICMIWICIAAPRIFVSRWTHDIHDRRPESCLRHPDAHKYSKSVWYVTIWLFNIAMGNGPFIDGLPLKNGDFPWLC